jgi:hypothetical protein
MLWMYRRERKLTSCNLLGACKVESNACSVHQQFNFVPTHTVRANVLTT